MRRFGLIVGAVVWLLGDGAWAQQDKISDYEHAKDVFWEELYPGTFEELYCAVDQPGRDDHNIEHVYAAAWMTRAVGCGSRKQCRRRSELFNRMEGDLHNLYPTRVRSNSLRESFPFEEVSGEDRDLAGCDFEVEDGIVEPRPEARGEIARAVRYMVEAYDAADGLPEGQLELMRAWDEADPPDEEEFLRNDLIALIQGNRNPFIDAHLE